MKKKIAHSMGNLRRLNKVLFTALQTRLKETNNTAQYSKPNNRRKVYREIQGLWHLKFTHSLD